MAELESSPHSVKSQISCRAIKPGSQDSDAENSALVFDSQVPFATQTVVTYSSKPKRQPLEEVRFAGIQNTGLFDRERGQRFGREVPEIDEQISRHPQNLSRKAESTDSALPIQKVVHMSNQGPERKADPSIKDITVRTDVISSNKVQPFQRWREKLCDGRYLPAYLQKIPRHQVEILESDSSWQPPLVGKTLRPGTLPIKILNDLIAAADQEDDQQDKTDAAHSGQHLADSNLEILEALNGCRSPAISHTSLSLEDSSSPERAIRSIHLPPDSPLARYSPRKDGNEHKLNKEHTQEADQEEDQCEEDEVEEDPDSVLISQQLEHMQADYEERYQPKNEVDPTCRVSCSEIASTTNSENNLPLAELRESQSSTGTECDIQKRLFRPKDEGSFTATGSRVSASQDSIPINSTTDSYNSTSPFEISHRSFPQVETAPSPGLSQKLTEHSSEKDVSTCSSGRSPSNLLDPKIRPDTFNQSPLLPVAQSSNKIQVSSSPSEVRSMESITAINRPPLSDKTGLKRSFHIMDDGRHSPPEIAGQMLEESISTPLRAKKRFLSENTLQRSHYTKSNPERQVLSKASYHEASRTSENYFSEPDEVVGAVRDSIHKTSRSPSKLSAAESPSSGESASGKKLRNIFSTAGNSRGSWTSEMASPDTFAHKIATGINLSHTSEIFAKFRATYQDYNGMYQAFDNACILLKRLQNSTNPPHPFLYDDMIYHHHHSYRQYLLEVIDQYGDALPFHIFYTKFIIQPSHLQGVVTDIFVTNYVEAARTYDSFEPKSAEDNQSAAKTITAEPSLSIPRTADEKATGIFHSSRLDIKDNFTRLLTSSRTNETAPEDEEQSFQSSRDTLQDEAAGVESPELINSDESEDRHEVAPVESSKLVPAASTRPKSPSPSPPVKKHRDDSKPQPWWKDDKTPMKEFATNLANLTSVRTERIASGRGQAVNIYSWRA